MKHRDSQEQFVFVIKSYSKRRKSQSLYPGLIYGQLAAFLSRLPSPPTTAESLPAFVVYHSLRPAASTTALSRSQAALSSHGQHPAPARDVKSIGQDAVLHQSSPLPSLEPDSGCLLFLRGYGTPQWIKAIGSRYGVDYEYFRRHLSFLEKPEEFYDLPQLPSAQCSILRLRVTEIFKRQEPQVITKVQSARLKEGRDLKEYQNRLRQSGTCGDTIVRRFSIHDGSIFTIEHDISICVRKDEKKSSWVGKSRV